MLLGIVSNAMLHLLTSCMLLSLQAAELAGLAAAAQAEARGLAAQESEVRQSILLIRIHSTLQLHSL
jgi:hypothetical protein